MKSTLALLLPLFAAASLEAQVTQREWIAGTGSTNFNLVANYDPATALSASTHLIFDSATDSGLQLTGGQAIDGITVGPNTHNFILGASGPTVSLTVRNGGISVAAGKTAYFDLAINSHGTASQLTTTVGAGGTMTVTGLFSPVTRAFYKEGAGTLVLEKGMGTNADNSLRNGTSINIREGTLEVGNDAMFQAGATLSLLEIHLGTAGPGGTTATLRGGGTFGGYAGKSARLTTYGSDRSIIEPAGDGSLYIQNLDASAGATFRFTLGSGVIEGSGIFTGSAADGGLLLDLSGGAVGETYTLFDFGSTLNLDVNDFVILNAGYQVETWTIDNGRVDLRLAAIPEPSMVLLGGVMMLGSVALRRYRRGAM